MKQYFAMILLALAATSAGLRAQGLDDQYFRIFNLIQEADTLSGTAPAKAVGKYVQAQTALQRFQNGNPEWNPQVVNFRLSYIAGRLAALSSSAPVQPPLAAGETNKPQPGMLPSKPPGEGTANGPGDLQAEVDALKDQVKQMLTDRALLEAKLKEALAAQPAESDPRELARAEDRIKTLQKENELLKASVQEKPKTTAADQKSLEQTQLALAEANRQATQQKELNIKLAAEKEALQARLKSNPDVAALQAENELLKKQILTAPANTPVAPKPAGSAQASSEAQAQIAALQSDKELLRLEKIALENRVKQLASNTPAVAPPQASPNAGDIAQLRQLERERDNLQQQLDAANKAAYGKKGKAVANRVRDLELQLSAARARLDVVEARQVPYTAEELALLKLPQPLEPQAVAAAPQAKVTRKADLRPSEAKLMSDAQSYFAQRQFDKAEAAYMELLKDDPRNQLWLANLSAVQCESGKLDAAETSAKAAVAENPEHVFSLLTLGLTNFKQKKYDEALDALSRAAKLDPQNAEIQNHLGLTLSEKGMRVPAESAFRKAIQLQPNYAQAHYNLAVAYALQSPAATELARFHYQKALALGVPRNPEVEQKLGLK